MGIIEFGYYLGIHHHAFIDQQIGNQGIDKDTLVVDIESFLLLDLVATFAEFNNESVFVSFLAEARFERIEDAHRRSDDRMGEFGVNQVSAFELAEAERLGSLIGNVVTHDIDVF